MVDEMKLYHFTSYVNLQAILRDGIAYGDVPTWPPSKLNAVWLTRNPDPPAQGWASLDPEKVRLVCEKTGVEPWALNKTGLILEVVIPSSDLRLVHWPKFARKKLRLPESLYRAIDETGGGESENWYIYRSVVAPEKIRRAAFNPDIVPAGKIPSGTEP